MGAPLSIVITALVHEGRILLMQRESGNFIGMWAIPGGKVEKDEHLADAAVRELKEESGIDADFREHLALVSEHLIRDSRITEHLLLHVCELVPRTFQATGGREGKVRWFEISRLEEMKDKIIPSDWEMIHKIVVGKQGRYFNSVMEQTGQGLTLKNFG